MKDKYKKLPLRSGVGIIVLNNENKVFVAKRIDNPKNYWQMPQGGIDTNESALKAAIRETYEETSIKSIKHIASINEWIKYKLPLDIAKNKWNGKFVGQMQKWFLFYFFGDDSEVNLNSYKNPEFSAWKWVDTKYIENNVTEFRKSVYITVFEKFEAYIKNETN